MFISEHPFYVVHPAKLSALASIRLAQVINKIKLSVFSMRTVMDYSFYEPLVICHLKI